MPKPAPKSALEHLAPHAAQRIVGTIRVRALKRGFYDNHLKEPGAVFTVRTEREIGSWMERAPEDAAAPETSEEPVEKPAAKAKKSAKAGKAEASEPSENDVL